MRMRSSNPTRSVYVPTREEMLEGAAREFSELVGLGASPRMAFLFASDRWDLEGDQVAELYAQVGGLL